MTIPRDLSNLAPGANTSGVLQPAKGGTGLTSPGTNGNVLTSNGTAWTSTTPSTPTAVANLSGGTAGVIPFQSGANTTSFTAAGTSGQVLTSAGTGTPTWTTPSAGAMTLITTVTANNTSQYVTFTNVSGYSAYMIIINNLQTNSSGSNPYLEFGTGSGPTWQTSSYNWVLSGSQGGTTFSNNSPSASAIIMGFNGTVGPSSRGSIGKILIGRLTGTSGKPLIGQVSFFNNGSNWTNFTTMGSWNDTADVTAIRIDYFANIVSGTASLYGISS